MADFRMTSGNPWSPDYIPAAPTFEEIRKLASAMDAADPLKNRVDALIDSARVNADDTIHVERAADVSTWDDVAAASLANMLAFCSDKEVVEWFANNGVEF